MKKTYSNNQRQQQHNNNQIYTNWKLESHDVIKAERKKI